MNRDLVVRILGDPTGFQDAVKNSTNSMKDFGGEVKNEGSNIAAGMNKVALGVGAVGVGLSVVSKKATDSVVDMVSGIKRLSRETGENETEMSRLLYAMQRTGVSAQEASTMFGVFQKQIAQTNNKTGDQALKQEDLKNKIEATSIKIGELTQKIKLHGDANGKLANQVSALKINIDQYKNSMEDLGTPLDKLGIQTKNADGTQREFSKVLLDVADKFKAMPNGAEKTADAMKLFGRSGKELLPILNQGSKGIEDLEKKADSLGITLTGQNLAKVNAYIKSQKDLKDSQMALTMAIGTEALPMQQKFVEAQNRTLQAVLSLPKPYKDAAIAVLAFGGPVLGATASVIGFTSNLVQAWPAIMGFGARLVGMAAQAQGAAAAVTGTTGTITMLRLVAASPIPAIVLAVAGVAAIIYAIQKVRELKAAWDGANAAAAQSNALDDRAIKAIRNNPNLTQAQKSARLRGLMDPGYRASGGPVEANRAYIVGEEGPELFVPGTSGAIIPNGAKGKSAPSVASAPSDAPMGGNNTINMTVNIGMYAGMPVERRRIAVELWRDIVREARSNGVQLPQIGVSPQ